MRSSRLSVAGALIAAVLAVAIPAHAAPAQNLNAKPAQNLNAKVKALATGLSEFSGRVSSTDPDCVKRRKIKISTPKQRLGKVKTNKEGRFLITRKSVRSGTPVTFALKARRGECIPLVATLTAP